METRIQDILIILDVLNATNSIRYDDYSRLYDMVSALTDDLSASNRVDG